MKKLVSSVLAAFILFGTITCTAAKSKTIAVKSIKLNKTSISIMMPTAKQYIIKATVNPKKPVKWSTSDKTVATVSGGKVTAIGIGTCSIAATVGKKKAICSVTVDKAHWSDGTYTVGKDIPAAEYILYPASVGKGKITIVNKLFKSPIVDPFEGREYVTLVSGETLTISNGKMYTIANAPKIKLVKGKYPAGMYKIGTDIPTAHCWLTPMPSDLANASFTFYKDSTQYITSVVYSHRISSDGEVDYSHNDNAKYLKIFSCTMSLRK